MKRMYEMQDGTFIDLMGIQAIEREGRYIKVKLEAFPEWKYLASFSDVEQVADSYLQFVKLVDDVKCGKVWIP